MTQCLNCKRESQVISRYLRLCAHCIKTDFDKLLPHIEKKHGLSRTKFNLPERIPKSPGGRSCNCCANECRMAEGEKGYCGLRNNKRGKISAPGVSNRRTLDNFASAARWLKYRKDPPLLIASTLMVPGYIDENEVAGIAGFIASLDPDIPYSLLGFYPHFFMPDLPCTSRRHAEACRQAALDAGLKRVKIGNIHLLI